MKKIDHIRLLILPDHSTPISLKTHKAGPVPFLLYNSTRPNTQSRVPFDERALEDARTYVERGDELIEMLFQG